MRLDRDKPRVLELFMRSRSWLLNAALSGESSSALGLGDLLRVLLGVWLCERASQFPVPSSSFHDLTVCVENRLRDEVERGIFDPFRYDAKLLLLCHHILFLHHCYAYGIESFAQQVGEALREVQDIPLRYIGEALLLSQSGYCHCPTVPPLQAVDAGGNALQLLRAQDEQIRTVCDNIAAATHFGHYRLEAAAEVRAYLDDMLPVLLLQSLRTHNLELGTILLRTISYLRLPRTRAVRLAVNFVVSQQKSDGRFGYFALEIAKLHKNLGSFDATNQLYLPITISCLWALAETLIPDFNLFSLPANVSKAD